MAEQITEEDVRHVAKLARLKLSDEQIEQYTSQLSHVLGYISKLNELDVDGVEPMAHPLDTTDVLRADDPEQGIDVELALKNAPQQMPPFFKVPKVLGDGGGA